MRPFYCRKQFYQFTQVITEKAAYIGCGLVQYVETYNTYYLACNYARGNVIGQPVYKKGTACSGCSSGCDTKFPALCSVNEQYDVNGNETPSTDVGYNYVKPLVDFCARDSSNVACGNTEVSSMIAVIIYILMK